MEQSNWLNLNRNILIFLFVCVASLLFSQNTKGFYLTTEILSIENPLLISVKGFRGQFIVSEKNFKESNNLKKLLREEKAFLYFDDSMGIKYFTNVWTEANIKKIECDCCIKTDYIDINNIHVIKLSKYLKSFYLGFTKTHFYNESIVDAENSKTYLRNDTTYRMILFPKCE
ncbi:hypothetical protein SAMN05421857_1917 [Chryseobacterium formosense]|nr:hypothetical protein [Chryseobacterium formosense]SFT59253.1 hypothetical protein SAMN05421857_1917 [Chryseobacterium formosense]